MAKNDKAFDPRPYMELAIVEMNKSQNEPRPDGKVPPKVGAILLFPNGDIVRAHRGELRDGDHAEFTLLERKLGDKKLDDCILFTTLEPCVSRNPPKIACCNRTSKARIKTVYVGITDPDHTVDGKGIKHLEDNHVRIIMFDRDLQKNIEDENSEFIKQANERKLKKEVDDLLTPLEKSLPTTVESEFSNVALQKFIDEANLPYKVDMVDFYEYLVDIGVAEFDEKKNVYHPNGFGVLLFGKNPRAKYKQAAMMATVDYGKDKVEPATFDQPLVLIPDLIEEWLKKALPLSKDTSSFKRVDVPDFPIPVLREAIINALVHRDFKEDGVKSAIEIDNDKIVVKSPGAPLPSISLSQLNSFNAPSISRNPIITYVFSLMKYVEEKGFGMRSMKSLNEIYKLPLPKYEMIAPFLTLTFPRNAEVIKKMPHVTGIEELNGEEISGYDWIRLTGEVGTREYSSHFNYGYKKAQRHLAKMKELNIITDNGEPINSPNYKYKVVNNDVELGH
jgi:ATP-dependent DNA helicase RecG